MLEAMWSFNGRYKILPMTWFAFFLTFMVWFNFPPFAITIGQEFGLTCPQLGTIGLCNVALTVFVRAIIGSRHYRHVA